jgi:hypothetical protein
MQIRKLFGDIIFPLWLQAFCAHRQPISGNLQVWADAARLSAVHLSPKA